MIEALDELELGSPSIGIRWPNDLEAEGRKLGGILPERVETSRGHRIMIGIGLNVRTNLAAAPAAVRAMATSLAELHARPLDESTSARLIPATLGHFESVLRRLARGDPSLSAQWSRLDLLREKWVRIDLGTRIVAGWGAGNRPPGRPLPGRRPANPPLLRRTSAPRSILVTRPLNANADTQANLLSSALDLTVSCDPANLSGIYSKIYTNHLDQSNCRYYSVT